MDAGESGAQVPAAAIHDLGYKRYVGTRRPQSTRWRVIVKNVLSSSWRGFWRMKVWVMAAVLTTVVTGALMYFWEDHDFGELARASGVAVTYADGLVLKALPYYMWTAFVVTLTVGAQIVGKDLRTGAFEFYFSRPVRPVDYVLGKVGGLCVIMGALLLAGPLLLALFRVGLADDVDRAAELAWQVPKVAAAGVVATLGFAITPLAFSAVSAKPRQAMIAWAAFYVIAGPIARAIGANTGADLLIALDLSAAVQAIAYDLYDITPIGIELPTLWAGLAAMGFYIAAGLGIVYWRIAAAERAGLGGG